MTTLTFQDITQSKKAKHEAVSWNDDKDLIWLVNLWQASTEIVSRHAFDCRSSLKIY